MRILVLGAGFGGLEVATRLSEELGADADVVLVDRSDGFVFGFSKLDVMFGRVPAAHVVHRYADVVKPGVRVVQATVTAIDPVARSAATTAGTFDADVLVVALGAHLHPELTPGLVEDGHEFYTVAGAFALAEVLAAFEGGRVVVGVAGTPFKCPPAPSETALLVHELLDTRGLLDRSSIDLVLPLGVPIPPSPQASTTILEAFAERGIGFHGGVVVEGLDPERHVALLSDGSEIAYDLFLGVPVHRAPAVVVDAGMTEDGWIPVDRLTLETRYPGVYAIGDVTSVGTPKAGVFAEGAGRGGRRGDPGARARRGRGAGVRRARHLLHGVRAGPDRHGRRLLPAGRVAARRPGRPVDRPHGREVALRLLARVPLVRSGMGLDGSS